MRGLILTALLAGCLAGCEVSTRPVGLEIDDEKGHWSLRGVQSLTLERAGWRVGVVESEVAELGAPRLQRLVLELTNTSDLPLVIEPGQVVLDAGEGRELDLAPARTVVLRQNESVTLVHDPGLRAELIPHPFLVTITVFRDLQKSRIETVKLHLY